MASERDRFDAALNSMLGSVNKKQYKTKPAFVPTREQAKDAALTGAKLQALGSNSSSNNSNSNVDVTKSPRAAENAQELTNIIGELLDPVGEGILPEFTRPVTNFGKQALGTAADYISRPLYGVYNGYVESKEAQLDRNPDDGTVGLDFGNLGEDFKNFGSGFLKGFTGAEDEDPEKTNRTTPGNAVELFTKKDFDSWKDSGVPVLGNNTFQTWAKRTAGLAGETLGDPANLIGGKAVGVLRSGARYTNKAARNAVLREATENALKNTNLAKTTKLGGTKAGKALPNFQARNAADFITDTLADQADASILTRGQAAVAANAAVTRSALVASGVSDLVQTATKKFENIVGRLGEGKLTMGTQTYRNAVNSDELVRQFDTLYKSKLEDIPIGGKTGQELIEETAEEVRQSMLGDISKFSEALEMELRGSMFNTFGIRIGNSTVPIRVLGQGLEKIRGKGLRAPKPLSINRQLPGKSLQATSKARRAGHVSYEAFRQRTSKVARQYSKSQREEIARHIHNGTMPNPTDELFEGVNLIKNEYRQLLQEELDAGVRNAGAGAPPNYQHMHYKEDIFQTKARKKTLENLRESRKAEGSAGRNLTVSPQMAKDAGLKVTLDPFEALAYRRLKTERMISRSHVTESFFRTYGISGNISNSLAKQQGWRKIARYQPATDKGVAKAVAEGGQDISKDLQGYVIKNKQDLYLPEDVAEAFDFYQNITQVGRKTGAGKELGTTLKIYDKLLNLFKVTATVPYPGFHVKNMAGDIFMGVMDGVNVRDYTKFIRENNLITNKTDKAGNVIRGKNRNVFGEAHMTNAQTRDLFDVNAGSGGFVETEITPSARFGTDKVRGAPRAGWDKLRGASEWREDIGRRVHFNHALEEELAKEFPGLTGEITPVIMKDKRFIQAVDNATYRVDKYKFDYGALTATEKNVMRRTIPFYTFMRKSAPMMLEGMLMNPALFGKTQRAFPEAGGGIPGLAPWQRELGLANLGGGDEPLLMPENVLPYDAVMDLTKDPLNPVSYFDTLLNAAAPLPKSVLELALNKTAFTGADIYEGETPTIKDTLGHLVLNNFAPARSVEKAVTQANDDEPFDFWEFLGGDRFALGLGVRRLTDKKQIRNLNGDLGQVKQELSDWSRDASEAGLSISFSDRSEGASFIVKQSVPRGPGQDNVWQELYEGALPGAVVVFDEALKAWDGQPSNQNVQYVDENGNIKYGSRGWVESNPLNRINERD